MKTIYWVIELEIKSGRSADFEKLMMELVDATRENEPDTLNYEWSTNADRTVCHIYERYTDNAAVMTHMKGFEAFASRFFDVLIPKRMTVYGQPDEAVKNALSALHPSWMRFRAGFSRD